MTSNEIEALLYTARRKYGIDQRGRWSDGSSTYLNEMVQELTEVKEEIDRERLCYLEDELGDVLWDYLNVLVCLERERGISLARVAQRAVAKYEERIAGIERGLSWAEIKEVQKKRLAEEYRESSA